MGSASTRWSTTLSSKVNLPHAIKFRALCGENLVTLHVGLATPPKGYGPTPPYQRGNLAVACTGRPWGGALHIHEFFQLLVGDPIQTTVGPWA